MGKRGRSLALVGSLALVSGWAASRPADQVGPSVLPPPSQAKVDFTRDVEPILRDRCQFCHGEQQQLGGLRLDNRNDAMKGGNSGPVIKLGHSADSKLIHLVAGLKRELVMPLVGERLTAQQVGLLRAWIDQGAEWTESPKPAHEVATAKKTKPKSAHWAFNPPERPPIPSVGNRAWVRNPIDAFVLAKLEALGIEPSPEADRETLIRRVSLDLIGLPPAPEEVAQFMTDNRPDAYERLVERLLASLHYGEKWARHWLDLAHYADSDGYEKDIVRPFAWRYRNWVIDALNRNKPFDEFTIEQLAGDLLPNATLEQKVATGFLRNTLTNREGGVDLEEFRAERVLDRTSTVGTTWLSLTVGCARCHDHKYDPITQREHYQLFAFFNTAQEVNIEAPLPGEMGPYLQRKAEYDKKRQALLAEYKVAPLQAEWEKTVLEAAAHPGVNVPYDVAWDTVGKMLDHGYEILRLKPEQRTQKQQDQLTDHFAFWYRLVVDEKRYEELKFKELDEKLKQLEAEYPPLTEAQTIAENPNPPKTHVLIRGDFRRPGVEVQPNVPVVLNPLPDDPHSTRLTLARWLVSKDNPLTARVIINRMWQEFFGRGIMETSEDFGTRGDRPSHPELLDWLATEFMARDWNLKAMQKLIVESATYRQSSKIRKDLLERDPYNRLLARQTGFRLPAELVRDVTLAAGGLLNPAIGGPSVRPPLPEGVVSLGYGDFIKWKENGGPDRYRRGLYIFFQRTVPYPQLMNFNAPDSLLSCSRRERATTPLQALNLLNDPVFFEAAQGLAARVLREVPGSLDDRLDYAFEVCLARKPTSVERNRLVKYYQQQREILKQDPESLEKLFPPKSVEGVDGTEAAAWVGLSSVLLNLDEFVTRE